MALPRSPTPSAAAPQRHYRSLASSRGTLTALLVAAFVWSLTTIPWGASLLHPGGERAIGQFFGALLRPELSPGFLALALEASWRTVAYAVAGVTVALAIGLPLGIVASGTLARGTRTRLGIVASTRFVLAALRAIHELVWAWLFVAALGLSPLAAILALGIPYGGILGRIYAGLLADVPAPPLQALRAAGASEWHILLYGRLPQALPDMLSYTFYRFECAIRSAAILSFVGLGGLGYQLQLALDDLRYGDVWTLLLFLVALVVLVDVWSSELRRRLAV
jgi:phosphonate transport system permease protein